MEYINLSKRTSLWVLLTLCFLVVVMPTRADDNLLQDGGMEGPYSGRGRGDFTAPVAWQIWYADSPRTEVWMNLQPVSFPHNGPDPNPHSGAHAMSINKGYATFTIAVYQQVSSSKGTKLHASVYAWVHACKLAKDAQKCSGSSDTGAYAKIGVDPNGGTNPQDSDIVWSPNSTPNDTWGEITVDATATGDTVTVFLFATQSSPSDLNKVYFDDASLTNGGAGGSAKGAAPTAPPFAPFVSAQPTQEDGSVIHTVQSGDTLDSIAVAYGVKRQDILDLNNITDPRIIQIGQKLLVKPATKSGGGSSTAEATSEDNATKAPDTNPTEGTDSTAAPQASKPPSTGGQSVAEVPTASSEQNSDNNAAPSADGTEPAASPTPAPTAPVVSVASGNVLPALNPADLSGTVCVLMFEDGNQNRIQEEGEALLQGGQIVLQAGSDTPTTYTTDGASEPHCVDKLAVGDYLVSATAPGGYGLTTSNQYHVHVNPGVRIDVVFGAARGVTAAIAPPPDNKPPQNVSQTTSVQQVAPPANPLMDNAGLIVFGIAGVVLVVGTGASFALRRH